jgi:hypothetical protein
MTKLSILLALVLSLAIGNSLKAQTNVFNTNQTVIAAGGSLVKTVADAAPTNMAVAFSAVWVPNAPKGGSQWGGAGTVAYNFNQNVGTDLTIERLGSEWLGISGQIQLGVVGHPLSFGSTNGFLANIATHEWVNTGVATTLNGGSSDGSLYGVVGGGAAIQLVNLGRGWGLGIHGGDNYWSGAGPFGKQNHIFGGLFLQKAIW